MASSYSPLKVELIGTGEQAGTWGTTTNTNLGTALEEAITGRATATFPSDADYTLPYIDSNSSQVFRNLVLNVTSSGNLSSTRNLIIPAIEKQYLIENNTSGSQSIVVKTAAGSGITVPNGRRAHVFCDGTTTRFADDFVDINGGAIDGTPIGAASASTGAFSTATITTATITTDNITTANITTGNITTANITTGNITTANITTGNINTLNVGTQTNKATISYTTNAARTLTVPAVSGNRTFAFIDEAQTFTANQSFNTLLVGTQTNKATISYTTDAARTLTVPAVAGNRTFAFIDEAQTFTANQTIGANLTFTGNQRRFIAPFDGQHQNANAFSFQNSTTNAGTAFGLIPNGTNKGTAYFTYTSSTDPSNSNYGIFYADNNQVKLNSDSAGTGVTTKLRIDTDDFERITVTPTGECSINDVPDVNASLKISGSGRTYSLIADDKILFSETYGNTVGATNRTLYIDSGGILGGLSSTRESKTNIAPIEDADWLMSLEPVSYNRRLKDDKDVYTDAANPATEFGLIADDVANVRPEICVFVKGKVSGINYEQLIAPMLKEIQKLRAEVNALKEKING